ncbi:AMIN-like domain-containing (lipo)protein [Corynebacterium halotolerans]|uniref:AMIN-like domain-containing protein n=1 Tax=Corynebacterium halotolerans YIM 70093 = DSM 44683 TaxID=1121362 RepID=M1NYX6_9CORY|nr:hypothetical protein [Corynebacterium halotolerans]AGF72715.1 hypothetical protein A605_08565 [Corynebacterium halotolerans YIM 70093 = DSM 44683]
MKRHILFPRPARAPLAGACAAALAAFTLSACGTGGTPGDDGNSAPETVTTTVTAPTPDAPAAPSPETTTATTTATDTDTGTVTVTVTVPPAASPTALPPLGNPDLARKQKDPEGPWRLAVTGVRVAEHERFDRLVFDLEGEGLPGWFIDYTETPAQQASGFPVEYEGAIALQVSIVGTPYPFDLGIEPMEHTTVEGAGHVTGVTFTSIFEGHSEFVIGLEEKLPYSVSLLQNPTRVVIDFAHD